MSSFSVAYNTHDLSKFTQTFPSPNAFVVTAMSCEVEDGGRQACDRS